MVTWQEDRLARFQALVNLEALPQPPVHEAPVHEAVIHEAVIHETHIPEAHTPEVGVVADWRAKLDPALAGGALSGWDLFFQHVRAESEGALGEWGLRRDHEQLAVKIYVSSRGAQSARLYFQHLAMSSTAPEYPYKPPGEDPNTVSGEVVTFVVHSPSWDQQTTHNDGVLRLFRNVVFDVRVYDSRINVLEIADDLLNFARQHSDVPLFPNLLDVEQIGLPEVDFPDVQIRFPVDSDELDGFQNTDLDVKVQTEGEVDFLGFDRENANFRWKQQPSNGQIRVQVIDRRTLLSRTLSISAQTNQPSGT